jgi:hypothetical protein
MVGDQGHTGGVAFDSTNFDKEFKNIVGEELVNGKLLEDHTPSFLYPEKLDIFKILDRFSVDLSKV